MMIIHREKKQEVNGWTFEEQKIVVPTAGTMEYVNDINIIEAVIHVLDSNGEEPVLNEYKLELTEEVYKFLFKHIERSFKDEELKYGIFNKERHVVKEVSQDFLNGHNSNIVEISKEFARQMFYLMKANKNISSCDLVTVYISTDQGPMLGILKMDYVKNFTHKVDFINEKIGIGIIEHVAALPNSKLKKSVFIKPIRENQEIDLMILDKTKDNYCGSNYFINNYLGCTVIENSRDETKNFLNAIECFARNEIIDDPEKSFQIREVIKNNIMNKEYIEINEVAEEILSEELIEDKQNFLDYIKSFGVKEVNIDKDYVAKKFKRIRLNLDKEIDLYLDLEAYKDSSKFEVVRTGDGTVNVILKNIKTIIEK